ncbi:hypothetical protein ACTFIR_011854, partial [Dictyostelium discoideum]
WKVDMQVSI